MIEDAELERVRSRAAVERGALEGSRDMATLGRWRFMTVAVAACALNATFHERAEAQGTWWPTSLTGAPTGRYYHTAVWTGSRMIVWGGQDGGGSFLNTGGLYDPTTDTWTPMSTAGAPSGRVYHSAVWTGSKMIVWGGLVAGRVPTNTGAIYDPARNTWTPIVTSAAPAARLDHTGVWTGSKMIVWGGDDGFSPFSDGGIYDPVTSSWTTMSSTGAPAGRYWHTSVWTGSQMIVWGGSTDDNTGGVYDAGADAWTATSTSGAPSARFHSAAVWTGSKMIVWGGTDASVSHLATGGVFDPATNAWAATTTTGAPSGRMEHTAVWSGSRMVVWGGYDGSQNVITGGIYDPATDTWTPTPTASTPPPRANHTAVWTGLKMIVWGSSAWPNTGSVYSDAALVPPPTSTQFFAVTPCRVADTRNTTGPSGGPALVANAGRSFPVAGLCGVPSSARAVALNVTVVDQTDLGDLRIYPDGNTVPLASTINFTPGKVRANNAVIPLGRYGWIAVQCDMPTGSTGQTHFLFDVTGYFQ
ncbi:MAG TPA: kelch repeat-containing protein [Vicinamibacteria bacterium]|nr:kelch repeat-containing protein [Vicinamibacteria bacterium]